VADDVARLDGRWIVFCKGDGAGRERRQRARDALPVGVGRRQNEVLLLLRDTGVRSADVSAEQGSEVGMAYVSRLYLERGGTSLAARSGWP